MSDETKTPDDPYDVDPSPAPPAEPTQPYRRRRSDGTFAPQHPDYLVSQATDFGFSQSEIDSFSSEALGIAIAKQHRAQQKLRDDLARERSISEATARQAPLPPASVSPRGEAARETEFDELGLDPAKGWDEDLLNVLRKQHQELKSLKAQQTQYQERDNAREARTAAEMVDEAFSSLPEKYQALFGKGAGIDFKDKVELRRRLAVLRDIGIVTQQGLVGLDRLPTKAKLIALIGDATSALYPQEQAHTPSVYDEPATPQKGRPTAEEWQRGAVARPTQRSGAGEPAGEEKAKKNLAKKMREQGYDDGGAVDTSILDGLPG